MSGYGIERCSGTSWEMAKSNTLNSQGIHKTTKDLFPEIREEHSEYFLNKPANIWKNTLYHSKPHTCI